MIGITFDTGALIALERRRPRMRAVLEHALTAGQPITVPTAAVGAVAEATLVDAIVMASAASRGDVVYTSDVEDLERLRRHFPGVRVLGV